MSGAAGTKMCIEFAQNDVANWMWWTASSSDRKFEIATFSVIKISEFPNFIVELLKWEINMYIMLMYTI